MMGSFFGSPLTHQSPFMAISDGSAGPHGYQLEERDRRRHRQPRQEPQNDLFAMSPFGGFGMMDSVFRNMEQNFERLANDPNSHCYSQSSVMSFSNTGSGAPQYYEATSSTQSAPGGVCMLLSSKCLVSVLWRIGWLREEGREGGRGSRKKEKQFGIPELARRKWPISHKIADAGRFNQEFKQKTSRFHRHRDSHTHRGQPLAIDQGPSYREREEDDHLGRPQAPGRGRKRAVFHDV
ncbi:putative myeloid leukemia factor 1-like [Apostichopus japonicus]|uniref:Putative myeloid leukemia factor 1-like n=1 Tax=Stichopus japonicus TaxID=307972 RepID=A0A2G8LF68_STIJA|nr:putative myeloid leukemia factor 1-like [Apostichopus japonicus]